MNLHDSKLDARLFHGLILLGAVFCLACGEGMETTSASADESLNVAPDGGASSNACVTASDCQGILPQYCMQCSADDSWSCVHWECIDNACVSAICPAVVAPPPITRP
jgi:hypothetical protein